MSLQSTSFVDWSTQGAATGGDGGDACGSSVGVGGGGGGGDGSGGGGAGEGKDDGGGGIDSTVGADGGEEAVKYSHAAAIALSSGSVDAITSQSWPTFTYVQSRFAGVLSHRGYSWQYRSPAVFCHTRWGVPLHPITRVEYTCQPASNVVE